MSFCTAALLVLTLPTVAQGQVVINEIHYDPDVKTEKVEFIELFNTTAAPINLAGWVFTKGVDYTFPAGAVLPANGYVMVTEDPADFLAKFGSTAFGPWLGNLSNDGEEIELRDAANKVVDKVDYQLGFPWPTVGDAPGYSIELIHPSFDNNLGGSWRISVVGGPTTPSGTILVPLASSWKYFKGTQEASTPDNAAWRQVAFNDGGWLTGLSPIFYETGSGYSGGTDLTGDMSGNYSSVYMRRIFNVTDPTAFSKLEVDLQADDGAIVWVNGVEMGRLGMAGGQIPYTGTALDATGEPKTGTYTLNNAAAVLNAGNNVIAVHAFNQALSGSSDFLIEATLRGLEGGSSGAGPSPGFRNVVFTNNIPPQVRQVDHSPRQPMAGQVVTLTAKATDPDGVTSMTLDYQIVDPGAYIAMTDGAYITSWTSLPMNDNGTGGDAEAGDDVYTVQLPASVQVNRRLVRYRITAVDGGGRSIRLPYADDPQPNFAYYVYNGVPAWQGSIRPGVEPVLTFPAEEMGRLPAYQLISKRSEVENCTWFHRDGSDDYRYIGTMVYDGEVYDHIRFRARGGVWRFAMAKNMWKFLFNRGHYFQARDNWGKKYPAKWRRLNLGASIQQGDFNHRGEQGMFESTGFRFFNLGGIEAPDTSYISLRIVDEAQESFSGNQFEGDFWGVYLVIEQMDGRYLDTHGLPDGNLYKMENGTGPGDGALKNQGPNQVGDNSDVVAFNNALGTSQSDAWWRANFDLNRYYNYYTILMAIHHYDICCGKNYYWYFNPVTGKMAVLPWDLDLTWAENMYNAGDGGTDEIYDRGQIFSRATFSMELGNRVREILDLLWNDDQAWRVLDEYAGLLQGPKTGPTLLDADRAMWDYNPKMASGTYSSSTGKSGQGRFYTFPAESSTNSALRGSFDAGVQILKNYVTFRGRSPSYQSGVTLRSRATDTQIPATPIVTYIGPGSFPLNELSFRVSNYSGNNGFAAMKWRIAEITPTNGPAYTPGTPHKYEIETTWDSGDLAPYASDLTIPSSVVRVGSTYRVRCRFKDSTGRWGHWSGPVEFVCGQPASSGLMVDYLRISEVMYNAPGGADYDYVELHNTSTDTALPLQGAKFTQGIDYQFGPGASLPPNGYLLVHRNPDPGAFRAYYGLDGGVALYGPFGGSLANDGEALVLRTSPGGTDLAAFEYKDGRGWPLPADGTGHSLVPLVMTGSGQVNGSLSYGGNWRASTYLLGSPGAVDPASPDQIGINEVVAHTDFQSSFDSNDWIELYNRGGATFTFGTDWYLSDGSNPTNLTKWMIPPGTMIPAGGFVTFDEQTGFHNPTNTGFGLNKAGEQVVLSYLPGTTQDRVVDSVRFKGQENDWSLGRSPDGGPWWYALTPRTRDAANAAPTAGVVISEIMYHPPDLAGGADDALSEYVELFNASGSSVALFDTNRTWRLDGGIGFDFPSNIVMAPSTYLLVVNFTPTDAAQSNAFRTTYGLTAPGLRMMGPYSGKLNNSTDRVALEKPQAPDLPNLPTDPVSWVIVDEVIYGDKAPWPGAADGLGPSLNRASMTQSGNDPANWVGAAPSPTGVYAGGNVPVITQQPSPATVVIGAGSPLNLSVSATGTAPLSYLWLFNGAPISGQTGSSLTIAFATPPDAGLYSVVVLNSAGSVVSAEVRVTVTTPPRILFQPTGATVDVGDNVLFTVTASGVGVLSYQWQKNGQNIPGALSSSLNLTDIQATDEGSYLVVVGDQNGLVVSETAQLKVLVRPLVILQPVSQSVVVGDDVTLSVEVIGTLPMGYRWRKASTTVFHEVTDSRTSFYTIENVQLTDAGNYTVVLTNQAFYTPGVLSRTTVITVLADTDGDRMPDEWETAYGLNPNDPNDAGLDTDGDGQTSLEEYQAGTDPTDPSSYLKVEGIETDFVMNGTVTLSFEAKTNRTYSILYRNSTRPGLWLKLGDVAGAPSNRVVEMIDQPSAGVTERYYRLVTPRAANP